jgi:Xaa-Pro dipeptidase
MSSTDTILKGKYPAKHHARRVANYLQNAGYPKEGIIYLESQKTRLIEDNDEPVPFRYVRQKGEAGSRCLRRPSIRLSSSLAYRARRQRRPFYYLSGCPLADSYLTYNILTDTLTLFIPPIEPDSVIWAGLPATPEEALGQYDVDNVLPSSELNAHLASFSHSPAAVYAIPEQVSEHVTFLGFKSTEFGILKKAIEDARVCKDAYEIALLRKANEVSTLAHTAVVRQARSAKNERELEATFIATCIANGCREQSYHSIVASGTDASTLHYVKNDQPLKGKLNILLDAGGEYNCYCADITRTFPINGTFSPESKEIYELVLEMQESCFKMLKEGVAWEDVHINAHKVAIRGLQKIGILKGSEQELLEKRISIAFFPHGLGHYLGMDTHDTGGNPNYADKDSMFRYLRVRCVFWDNLLQACSATVLTYTQRKFACRMRNYGGARHLLLQVHHRAISRRLDIKQVHRQGCAG